MQIGIDKNAAAQKADMAEVRAQLAALVEAARGPGTGATSSSAAEGAPPPRRTSPPSEPGRRGGHGDEQVVLFQFTKPLTRKAGAEWYEAFNASLQEDAVRPSGVQILVVHRYITAKFVSASEADAYAEADEAYSASLRIASPSRSDSA